MNDTDGDGIRDYLDSSVKNTIKGVEYKELDLMPLKIDRPVPYDASKHLTLTVDSGYVRFWSDETKETEVNIDTFINTWANDTPKVAWVEALVPSDKVADIKLTLKYDGSKDAVRATAVWGAISEVNHDKLSPADLKVLHPEIWEGFAHRGTRDVIEDAGGTGLIPVAYKSWVSNGILMQFRVFPPGIEKYRYMVEWDVTQRVSGDIKSFTADGTLIDEPKLKATFDFPDMHPDAANDDGNPNSGAESSYPDEKQRLYHYDAPGVKANISGNNILIPINTLNRANKFETFLRINIGLEGINDNFINPPTRPSGGYTDVSDWSQHPLVSGSRASEKYLWSVAHTLVRDAGKLKRTTGDADETADNNVKPGW